jgi:hypothetical protein
MEEAPFDIIMGLWASDGFSVLVLQGSLWSFCKGSPGSGYLACICLAILGGLLGKSKVEHMGLQSISPTFYRTYLIEEWYN